jgi:hypothetical protein
MELQNLWKFKTPDEQIAYQEGYLDSKHKYKGDFKYGLFTGFAFSFICLIINLTFKLYM